MASSDLDAHVSATPGGGAPAGAPLRHPPPARGARRLRDRWREFRRQGIPAIWFTGLMTLAIVLLLGGMITLVMANGLRHLWPARLVEVRTADRAYLGPVVEIEREIVTAGEEPRRRILLKIGNRDVYGLDFRWLDAADIVSQREPAGAVLLERREHGNLHGYLLRVVNSDGTVAAGPAAWDALRDGVRKARNEAKTLRKLERGIAAAIEDGASDGAALEADRDRRVAALHGDLAVFALADSSEKEVRLADIVRCVRPNAMNVAQRAGHYVTKLHEFLWSPPRESNTEGGIFPALFGTLLMVMLMTLVVVPLGVVAALYLHEYARQGPALRAVRLAVSNLAGVPSIVFGMFGLAFFVYGVGGFIDRTFYAEALPNPTFGTGGLLWASLTLALLTMPVVIVATEEGLAAVPRANREGALALGATQWQTLRNVVLPNAMPGILTGLILAVSRGAGEVAPLMLTGVVKLAPALALDGSFPFLHLERKFMHLGFHIYDVSMQSPNVEAAKPMVYTTTLLLLVLVVALNATAIVVRNRMRARYRGAAL